MYNCICYPDPVSNGPILEVTNFDHTKVSGVRFLPLIP